MKTIILISLVGALNASNSVTVTDTSGSLQTSRPVSISRIFTTGEIAAYAQPSGGGTPLTTWQCDRKSQWADGSLKHAIISFTQTISANGSVTIAFVNNVNPSSAGNQTATNSAALTQAQM